MSKQRIFKNEEHQKQFNKQGFVVLPFLTQSEVQYLDAFFDEMHPIQNSGGFFSGSYSNDAAYKKRVSDKIVHVFSRAYDEIFENYKPFGGTFLYKVPGTNSQLSVHQDWSTVDESKDIAINCWVPLCDTNEENGALSLLPGSQFDNYNVIRSPTLPFFFSGSEELIMKELVQLSVPAGSAVILDQSLIHYSPPNRSNKIRKAITAGIKNKCAQMYFYYKVPDADSLEIFEMEDDFLISFKDFRNDIGKRPYLGKSVGFIPYKLPLLNAEVLQEKLTSMKVKAGFEPINKQPSGFQAMIKSAWKHLLG